MCLLFLAYNVSAKYRLIVAANRDEFLDRPTAALSYLDDTKNLLAGKDLRGGGTWLGVSESFRIGAITNYRDVAGSMVAAPSRGELILNYLEGELSAENYMLNLSARGHCYEGFNLLLADADGLFYFSNKNGGVCELEPGYYGLSNGLLDTPWPKVTRGKKLLKSFLCGVERVTQDEIFNHLQDSWQPPDNELPDTGVGVSWERLLGTIFIDGAGYGTRSSAIVTVTHGGDVEFTEKTYHRSMGRVITSTLVKRCHKA